MTLSSTSLYASHKYGKYHCHIIAHDVKYITATVVSIALCFSSSCVVPNSLEFFCADSAAISYITGAQRYRILSCLFFFFHSRPRKVGSQTSRTYSPTKVPLTLVYKTFSNTVTLLMTWWCFLCICIMKDCFCGSSLIIIPTKFNIEVLTYLFLVIVI